MIIEFIKDSQNIKMVKNVSNIIKTILLKYLRNINNY